MKTNTLLKQIRQEHASAFTHSGKFHADDVFSACVFCSSAVISEPGDYDHKGE